MVFSLLSPLFLSIKLQKLFFAHLVADSNTQLNTHVNRKLKIPCSQLQKMLGRKLHFSASNPNVLTALPMFRTEARSLLFRNARK
jgi:hypothetical protein